QRREPVEPVMSFYWLLSGFTLVIVTLAALIWWRSREPGFLVGIFFLYFWSLWGAWFFVQDQLGGVSIMHYQFLLKDMFPVALDADYAYALTLYSIFIIMVEATLLYSIRPGKQFADHGPPIAVSHPVLIAAA